MPSVIEGLSIGDDQPSGEVVDPFEESFLAKIAGDEPVIEPGTPEEPAGQPRDQEGRFVAADPGTPEPVEQTPAEGADAQKPGESNIAYEARLAAKDEFIGRQSTEIGELRARLDAFEKQQAEQPADEQYEPLSYIQPEQAEQIVESNGGEQALWLAVNEGIDPDSQAFRVLFDAAADAAESQADIAALLRLEMQYRAEIDKSSQVVTTPAEDPALAFARQTYLESQVYAIATNLRENNPDFDALTPHFEAAAKVANLTAQLESGDPAKIGPAVATMVLVARGIAAQAGAATSQSGEQAASAAAVIRQAAQVASGSLRSADSGGAPVEVTSDEEAAAAAFKKAFRETATPSVAAGLSLVE